MILDATWTNWNQTIYYGTTGTITMGGNTWGSWNQEYQLTEEQIAERAERQARHDQVMQEQYEIQRREQAERTRIATEAGERANELLIELLSDEQQRTWIEHHWFEVRGSETGRVYRIRYGDVNNVDRIIETEDGGRRRERVFCAHPPGLPLADSNLAQMLLLTTDESAFIRVANHHAVAGNDAELPEDREARHAVTEDAGRRFHETLDRLAQEDPVNIAVDRRHDDPVVYNMDVEQAVFAAYGQNYAV